MPLKRFARVLLSGAIAVCAFAQQPARPASSGDISNLPVQKIGKEDLLGIQVYDSPELTRSVRVNAEGFIRLPMLKNPIRVEGLLPADVEVLTADALKKEGLLVDPFVTVTMAEYHSRPITVTGAVRTPTNFQAIGSVTLLDALAKAGGLDPQAGGEIIVTKPNGESGQSIQRVPVKALLSGADGTLNLKLTGGEQIMVPVIANVVVFGNVHDPGVFPVQDTGTTTVMTAIAQAKGLGQYQPPMVYIYRTDDQGVRHEIPVSIKDIQNRKLSDVVLQPKDLLYVPENARARVTATTLDRLAGFGASTAAGAIIYKR